MAAPGVWFSGEAGFTGLLELLFGRKAVMAVMTMQPGDVSATRGDIDHLGADTGFSPEIPLERWFERFVRWYREHCPGDWKRG
jgi:UDP-glucuronate 4-epimerase